MRPRHVVAIAAILGTAYVLGPVAASAAGTLMTITDGSTNADAQVDVGKLRVGDGSGALTVDGTVTAVAPQKLRGNSFTKYLAQSGSQHVTSGCLSGDLPVDMGITTISVKGQASIQRRYYNGSSYGYTNLWKVFAAEVDTSEPDSVREYEHSVSFPTPIAVNKGTAVRQCIYVTLYESSSINIAYFYNT
jgi:hypothetical protein